MEHGDISDIKLSKIVSPVDILTMQKSIQDVHIEKDIVQYIVKLVQSTRFEQRVEVGISPRGSIALFKLSKAHAAFYGRDYVVPDDVKNVAFPALCHRLILKPEARVSGVKPENVIKDILIRTPVPLVR